MVTPSHAESRRHPSVAQRRVETRHADLPFAACMCAAPPICDCLAGSPPLYASMRVLRLPLAGPRADRLDTILDLDRARLLKLQRALDGPPLLQGLAQAGEHEVIAAGLQLHRLSWLDCQPPLELARSEERRVGKECRSRV